MARNADRTRADLPEHRRRIYDQDICHDYDPLIERALALPQGKHLQVTSWPDGRAIASWDDANRLLNKIKDCKLGRQYSIRRHENDGLGPRQLDDGTWCIRFVPVPKARAGTTSPG